MKDTVNVEVAVPIAFLPWQVPEAATQQVSGMSATQYKIADLDQKAVDALTQRWLDDVYKAAGKPNPFKRMAFRGA